MTATDFDRLLDARLEKTRRVLASKAGEYATEADRLHNFKRAARLRDGNWPTDHIGFTADALLGMLVKHWISIEDMVGKVVDQPPPAAVLDEKLGGAINYLILLEAVLTEKPK